MFSGQDTTRCSCGSGECFTGVGFIGIWSNGMGFRLVHDEFFFALLYLTCQGNEDRHDADLTAS